MRLLFYIGVFAVVMVGQARSADRAAKLIAYCREHSVTPEQHIACLENALNIVLLNNNTASSQGPAGAAQSSGGDYGAADNQYTTSQGVSRSKRPTGLGAEQVPLEGKAKEQAGAQQHNGALFRC